MVLLWLYIMQYKRHPWKTEFHNGISSNVPNSLPSLLTGESVGNKSGLIESNHLPGQQKFEIHGTPAFHPHSLPEFHDGISNCIHHNSLGNVAASINSRPSERIDNLQFGRVNSNGNLAEFNECGKCDYLFFQLSLYWLICMFHCFLSQLDPPSCSPPFSFYAFVLC